LQGSSFGTFDTSLKIRISGTASEWSRWTSDSSISARIASGVGQSYAFTVSVSGVVNAATVTMSFAAPLVRSSSQFFGATTGGFAVTLAGTGFGVFDSSVTVRVGASATQASVWVSDSSCIAKVANGVSSSLRIQTTVGRQVSLISIDYSFLSPIVSVILPSSAPVAGTGLTLFGSNFGVADFSPRARIGVTACAAAMWTSDSSLTCRAVPAAPGFAPVVLTAGMQLSDRSVLLNVSDANVNIRTSARILLPSVIPNCSVVTLDSSLSQGGGGLPLSFTWLIRNSSQHVVFSVSTQNLTVAVGYMPIGSFTTQLSAVNWLGISSETTMQFQIVSQPVPVVAIVPVSGDGVRVGESIRLSSTLTIACNATFSDLRFLWSIFPQISTPLSSSRSVVIPAFSLVPLFTYTVSVVAVAGEGFNSSSTVVLRTLSLPPVASVAGEDRISFVGDEVRIDGSSSFDPDVASPTASVLSFRWSCFIDNVASCTGVVGNAVSTSQSSVLVIPPNAMASGLRYRFELFVSKQNLSSSATVFVTAVSRAVPRALVTSSQVLSRVDRSFPLSLSASVSYTDPVTRAVYNERSPMFAFIWSCVGCSDVLLDANTLSGTKSFVLTIASGVLRPSFTYAFNFTAVFNDTDVGYSAVTVRTNGPPQFGACAVEPTRGVAVETEFRIACSNWVDDSDDLPLQYFARHVDGFLVTQVILTPSFSIRLPAGSASNGFSTNVIVFVGDRFENYAAVNLSVVVEPAAVSAAMQSFTSIFDSSIAVGDTSSALSVAVATSLAVSGANSNVSSSQLETLSSGVLQLASIANSSDLTALNQIASITSALTSSPTPLTSAATSNLLSTVSSVVETLNRRADDANSAASTSSMFSTSGAFFSSVADIFTENVVAPVPAARSLRQASSTSVRLRSLNLLVTLARLVASTSTLGTPPFSRAARSVQISARRTSPLTSFNVTFSRAAAALIVPSVAASSVGMAAAEVADSSRVAAALQLPAAARVLSTFVYVGATAAAANGSALISFALDQPLNLTALSNVSAGISARVSCAALANDTLRIDACPIRPIATVGAVSSATCDCALNDLYAVQLVLTDCRGTPFGVALNDACGTCGGAISDASFCVWTIPPGAIAGIVVGAAALAGLVALTTFVVVRRRRLMKRRMPYQSPYLEPAAPSTSELAAAQQIAHAGIVRALPPLEIAEVVRRQHLDTELSDDFDESYEFYNFEQPPIRAALEVEHPPSRTPEVMRRGGRAEDV
jgi:hypothetical protein